jgi:DNA polymerase-3 subunit beta
MSTAVASPPTTNLAFRAEAKQFGQAAEWVAKHINPRPTAPVLGGIQITATDGQVVLSGFDYNVASTAEVDTVGTADGQALVSGRLLAVIAKTFPNKPVDASIDGGNLLMVCGGVRFTLPLMQADDYPTLPPMPPAIGTVDAAVFATAVERVAFAAAISDAIPELMGLYLTFDGADLRVMASDRYRIAVAHIDWVPAFDGYVGAGLVSAVLVRDVARASAGAGEISVSLDNGNVGLCSTGRTTVARLISPDKYPIKMAENLPPRVDTPAVIPVAEVVEATRRAALVLEPKMPVLLAFEPGRVTVSGAGLGAIGEQIEVDHGGANIKMAFNPQYLVEALSALHAERGELHITGATKPLSVTAPDDERYRHVLMPIRLQAKPAI